nr:MAG TPA: Bifunctional protein FolD [Caudoviricetes sp.]
MSEKYLGLIGPEDSVYLRLIQRKADKAGLPVLRVSRRSERCGCYVIDSETGDAKIDLTFEEDIDCVQHPGMSCVAEAALQYVHRMFIPLSVVGLIGRRHAVQGLGEALVRSGHAVLPCNRAMHPWKALYGAQIIVNSAPKADRDLLDAVWEGKHRVIDISGALEPLTQSPDWKGLYISRGEIGRKNVEILLDRAQAALAE